MPWIKIAAIIKKKNHFFLTLFYFFSFFLFHALDFFSIISLSMYLNLLFCLYFLFSLHPPPFFIAFLHASLSSSVKLIIAVSRGTRQCWRHKHSETIPNFAKALLLSLQNLLLKYCKAYQILIYWQKDIKNAAHKHKKCKRMGKTLYCRQKVATEFERRMEKKANSVKFLSCLKWLLFCGYERQAESVCRFTSLIRAQLLPKS